MKENLFSDLTDPKSTFAPVILEKAKSLVEMSRTEMQKLYGRWDNFDDVYRGIRYPDKTDLKTRANAEPEKMVVPIAFAQVQVFVAFCLLLFTQKDTVYELEAQNAEDEQATDLSEALLQRDLDHSQFTSKLYQFLLDTAKFGLGIFKHAWTEERQNIWSKIPVTDETGATVGNNFGYKPTTTFQGNKIFNISPYRFFFDTRLPLCRFQEGEFCASEDEFSMTELRKRMSNKEIVNVDKIQPLTDPGLDAGRRERRGYNGDLTSPMALRAANNNGVAVVTECQIWITPSEFKLADGTNLGDEDFPVLFVIEYANDNTLLRVEPMGYVHNSFTYDVAEFAPDQHHTVNAGLSETIDQMQSVISWFINSHITSVRRVINNRFIIDPSGIELEDIKKNEPYIRLKQAAQGEDVRAYMSQLQVQDVTGRHMEDASDIKDMLQMVTSITDNTLGQYATGRRSATEARNVNLNGMSRLKVNALLIYSAALGPMGKKLLSNLRDGLTIETYVKIKGTEANPQEWQTFHVTRDQLAGDYDFTVFDLTLPSEKVYLASQLQDLLGLMMSNPEAAAQFGFSPSAIMDKMMDLRGVRNLDQYKLSYQQQLGLIQQQQVQNGQPPSPQPGVPGPNPPGPVGAGTPPPPTGDQQAVPVLPFGAGGSAPTPQG